MRRWFTVILILAGVGDLHGCSAPTGPELLTISSAQYPAAVDAAVEAARRDGLRPALRDRRSGVIETEARVAGSVFEPWRTDNASLGQAVDHTVAYERRRARFEFVPVGFQPDSTAQTEQGEPLPGPDVIGTEVQPVDLTQTQGELELRVWVYVERANNPGLRRGTWSRRSTTIALLVAPEGETWQSTGVFWTPVARDTACERRLLAAVQASLGDS